MLDLRPGERVIAVVRRHWYAFFAESFFLAFLAMLPVVLWAAKDMLAGGWLTPGKFNALMLFGASAWWFVLWITFFIIWTNYYLDMWIVTDRRVVDIEQHGVLSREVSECRLDRIEDITVEVHGALATLFGFGNIAIQTAAEARRFVLHNVPHPHDVKDVIMRAQERCVREHRERL